MRTPAPVLAARAIALTLSIGLCGWLVWKGHSSAQPESPQPAAEPQAEPQAEPTAEPAAPAPEVTLTPEEMFLFSSKSIAIPADDEEPEEPSAEQPATPGGDHDRNVTPTFFPTSKSAAPLRTKPPAPGQD